MSISLNNLTVKELREFASDRNIYVPSGTRKAEMVALLSENEMVEVDYVRESRPLAPRPSPPRRASPRMQQVESDVQLVKAVIKADHPLVAQLVEVSGLSWLQEGDFFYSSSVKVDGFKSGAQLIELFLLIWAIAKAHSHIISFVQDDDKHGQFVVGPVKVISGRKFKK